MPKKIKILSFYINSGVKKFLKNLQKLNEASRIEDFVNGKLYHTLPEDPGYDIKKPPQHGVSDPIHF